MPAEGMSDSLAGCGFELARFKTGTPCRLNGRTIDFSQLQESVGDSHAAAVLVRHGSRSTVPQVICHLTTTTQAVHDLIRANLHRAPMYSGQIDSRGPRYCPSIEDKVVRFADKTGHQIFLEPEGLTTREYYCNGISTSLPKDVQQAMLRLIPGLEHAEVMRWGYAVEYDYAPPTQLRPTLETKPVEGPVFRRTDQRHHRLRGGRRPGPDGRAERRPQGSRGSRRWCSDRSQAYIGVLLDDLVTKGVDRAVPHVHEPGRVPPAAAARQRRPPADAASAVTDRVGG